MKLAFIAPANSIHTIRWVNALADRGIDVTLYSMAFHENRDGTIRPEVRIRYLPGKGVAAYYLSAPQLRRLLREDSPDLVNAHYASGYGTLARMAGAKPLLLNVWGSDVYEFPYQSKVKYRILEKNLRYADAVASTSHSMAQQVRTLLHEPQKEIPVTPFGVDLAAYAFPGKERTEDTLTVGIVKTLAPIYAVDDLIRGFARLRELDSSLAVKLVIYGDGPQRRELELLSEACGVSEHVTFAGRIPHDEVPAALRAMDLFVLPSSQESFGVVAVEAMAAGLPVVATDVPGFQEIVVDGVTGLIVPTGSPDALAQAMQRLLKDPETCRAMGAAGRARVEELYDWDKNVDHMIEVYDSMRRGVEA